VPNDIPDWTGHQHAGLVGLVSDAPLGDTGVSSLSADSATASCLTSGALNPSLLVLVSFKAAAGAVIALVKAGAFKVGSSSACAPAFGQATTAGSLLVAIAGCAGTVPAITGSGWVAGTSGSLGIWYKPNCGAGESPPTFSAAGATSPIYAQLLEFSGADTSAPGETSGTALSSAGASSITAACTAVDAAVGNLIVSGVLWSITPDSTATLTTSYNNATAVRAGDSGTLVEHVQAAFDYGVIPPATTIYPLGTAEWDYDVVGYSDPGGGTQASVVFPAVAGKAYRLAHISASEYQNATTAGSRLVQVLDGVTVIWKRRLGLPGVAGSVSGFDLSGLAIKGAVGNSMTVQFDAGVASIFQTVAAGAYLR
jgi:hypothetical protein